MSVQRRVLISGAGVAGPVLAYWLHRFGFEPTVVEQAPQPRAGGGGHAVDLFGPVLDVLEWMGVRDQIEAARTTTEIMTMIRPGRPPVDAPMAILSEGVSQRHIEIMRGDLAGILVDKTRHQVEYIFGDSIRDLVETNQEVTVAFERTEARRFDLVVGADGLHSITRRLAFGPETQFSRFLGGYLAAFTMPNHARLRDQMVALIVPGRLAAIYPVGDQTQARAGFFWRTPKPYVHDRHDTDAKRRLLHELYGDLGWEVPRLLAGLDDADDLYMDSISQIIMPTWARGRIALIGDAGYCPGPAVGGGTSLAIIGAYLLACELLTARGDHTRALPAYQHTLEPVVGHSREIGPAAMNLIIPSTPRQIWLLGQGMRLLPHLPAFVRRRLTSAGGGAAAMLDDAHLVSPDELPRR